MRNRTLRTLLTAALGAAAFGSLPSAALAYATDQDRFFEEQRGLSEGGSFIIHPQSRTSTGSLPKMCRVFNQPGLDVVLFTVPCESLQPRVGARGPAGGDGAEAAGVTGPQDCLTEQM